MNFAKSLGKEDLPSIAQVEAAAENIIGEPTHGRILIMVYTGEKTLDSGIIMPGTAKEDLPKRGAVVKVGYMDEEDVEHFDNLLNQYSVVTYGLYAGKKIDPVTKEGYEIPEGWEFSVLAFNEIMFIENNIL